MFIRSRHARPPSISSTTRSIEFWLWRFEFSTFPTILDPRSHSHGPHSHSHESLSSKSSPISSIGKHPIPSRAVWRGLAWPLHFGSAWAKRLVEEVWIWRSVEKIGISSTATVCVRNQDADTRSRIIIRVAGRILN